MRKFAFTLAALLCAAGAMAQTHLFDINTKKLGAQVPSTLYGIFIEDINYAADGGLYGELVKNRSFEFPDNYMGWAIFGGVSLKDDGPFDKNPHYVRLADPGHHDKFTGIENEGFFGIGYEQGAEYRFSVWARVPEGGQGTLRIMFCDPSTMEEQQQFTEGEIKVTSTDWQKYTLVLTSKKTLSKGTLRVMLGRGSATVDVEHVSLFPVDTYNGHENGMRKDLAQLLEDLKPGVFRFPGGCIIEGTDLDTRYQWKNSVGPVENRPLNENRWHYTFDYRLFPDYFQSYGLGFYEYFLLSEEIGAEPLPVLNVGMACQYQNDPDKDNSLVPLDQLQPYIDDVIDLIDFANGDPATNQWAKLRADMGHPEPFNLKYVGIGNEQWDQIFVDRLTIILNAVRKVHPEIHYCGSSGPNSEGEAFDWLWPEMTKLKCDLVDEHFYRPERWFLKSGPRYDNYDRKGPKVFAGEYACHGAGKKWNHYNAALMEAAFLTGVERNCDIVEMATPAPLFAHIDGWQWRPDLIWYDNLRSYGTCSYYVQQLYSLNKGTNVLSLTMDGQPVEGLDGQDGLFASAVYDQPSNSVIVKIVNTGDAEQDVTLNLKGLKDTHETEIITYNAADLDGENTLDEPTKYVPQSITTTLDVANANVKIAPRTFALYKIKK